MATGSWLMAQGSWLMPQGSWLKAHASWPIQNLARGPPGATVNAQACAVMNTEGTDYIGLPLLLAVRGTCSCVEPIRLYS